MLSQVLCDLDFKLMEDYIDQDYFNCPYFYTNLKKRNDIKEALSFYISTFNGQINFISLYSFDCLHFYSKDVFMIDDEFNSFIDTVKPKKIILPGYFIGESIPNLNGFKGTIVSVMEPKRFLDFNTSVVKNATLCDIPRIAQFMYLQWSDLYESAADIQKQFEYRISNNFGRTKFIEYDGSIVACISSYAEISNFSVCGGLLVSPNERRKKLGSIMLKSIHQELMNEGKHTCGFSTNHSSELFHLNNGFECSGRIIKYVRV